jgi:alcohol dehydrogenase class IV
MEVEIMEAREFILPTKIIHGLGSLQKLKEELAGRGLKRSLIVTDIGIVQSGIVDRIRSILSGGEDLVVYDQVGHQATLADVRKGLQMAVETRRDSVIPVGGGSALVAGRAIAVAATNPGPLTKYEGLNVVKNPPLAIIAIPTTAGSGSEVSQFIPIIDDATQRKFVVGGYHCFPNVAILDGTLLSSIPPGQAALSGVDALTHAMEAYLTTMATPITDALALAATRILASELRLVVNTADLEARQDCLVASTMANMACTNARLGMVHTLARSINSLFPNVPYGKTIGVLLIPVMWFNLPGNVERFCDLADCFGYSRQAGTSKNDYACLLMKGLMQLLSDVKFPRRFEKSEVSEDSISTLADLAFEGLYGQGVGEAKRPMFVPGVNVQRATYDDVIRIYRAAVTGWELP